MLCVVNLPATFQADIAFQLMKLAELLTNNKAEFALYFTDIHMDMFAVDGDGKVKLVDLQNILVVDKQAVKSGRMDSILSIIWNINIFIYNFNENFE